MGDSIAAANGQKTQGVGPWSEKDYRNGSDIQDDDYLNAASHEQRVQQMQAQAGSASAATYVPGRAGGMTALPVEVQSALNSGGGYLPSMYPDPQQVSVWRDRNTGVTHHDFDTSADAMSVRPQSALVAGVLPPVGNLPSPYGRSLTTGEELAYQLVGGVQGVALTGIEAANSTVRILGNTVLQIGDILTAGVNHDSPIIQQAWIEQGALAQGVVNLVTSPRVVAGQVIDNIAENYARAEALRAQGDEIGAARINANQTSAIAAGVLGGAQSIRDVARLGAAGLRELGVQDYAFKAVDLDAALPSYGRSQRGAIGIGLEPIPNKPATYSVAFETQLDVVDFGKSRDVHFNRANAALDKALQADSEFSVMMEKLIPGVQDSVSAIGGRTRPSGWIWEHASSSTAFGQQGIMRLVPSYQHTPGSSWWRALHPNTGASGGYAEWAIPAGAPKN
ncbi:hypothetical protein [Variovorax sp. YR566]|uniref:hypothetical protein n=1 Tax=Variovorax sp. YR566 TaxID=3450237 RepID=UPI003F819190